MLLLTLFAFVAGAGTALSPCSLPILPALLSASATGGRRRPAGIIVGLSVTFTLTIIGLAEVVDGVGLGTSVTRDIAIVALGGFGIAVLVPAIAQRLEAPLSRLAALGPRTRGDGFVSGLGVGAALGFVHAPCAGPILAAVIAVSAASSSTVLLGVAFSLGSALVLFGIALGGRALVSRLAGGMRGLRLQQGLGGVMLLTAVLMAFSLDVRFQNAIANHIPDVLVDPTKALEDSKAVKDRLADLRGTPKFAPSSAQAAVSATPPLLSPPPTGTTGATATASPKTSAPGGPKPGTPSSLPVLGNGPAPEITGTQKWFNGPPETIAANVAQHKVTVIDFWTYTCINCLRTLPYLKAWDARYRDAGLNIVGVHAPEFSFEKDAGNVGDAIKRLGIKYPVVQDNDMATWNAWGNQYWPATYLIDAKGNVRYAHFGEGDDDKTEAAIRSLLVEAGGTLGAKAKPENVVVPVRKATPETYLGSERAQGWAKMPTDGTRSYTLPKRLDLNQFALGGRWTIGPQSATATAGSQLGVRFQAKNVYLVLGPPAGGGTGTVTVDVDGKETKTVRVDRQKLYTLASFDTAGTHDLRLHFGSGVSGYAFTFG